MGGLARLGRSLGRKVPAERLSPGEEIGPVCFLDYMPSIQQFDLSSASSAGTLLSIWAAVLSEIGVLPNLRDSSAHA